MATLRPYHYTGGTLYATMSTSSSKGNALYYDGYYNQCGWTSIFYNNTGRDIVIHAASAMLGVWSGTCDCQLVYKVFGTSVPDSFNGINISNNNKTIGYPGKTIISYTTWSNLSINVPKGNYFAIGVRTVNANSNQYFCMARTGITTGDSRVNRYNIFYSQNGGAWKRDYSTVWKYQVPEIYVTYDLASIPVYINGATSKSDTFYQGSVRSYSLSGYTNPSVSSNNAHIGVKILNNKLYVWANLFNRDESATITVYGYNSNAYLYVTAKKSSMNSMTADKLILRPGQSTNFKYSYTGAGDYSDTVTYGVHGAELKLDTHPYGWCMDYDLLQIKYDNNTYIQTLPNYLSWKREHTANSGTLTFGAITDSTTIGASKNIIMTSQVWTSYGGGSIKNPNVILGNRNEKISIGRFISGTEKSINISLQHWSVNDIYVVKSSNKLLYGEGNFVTITNLTNIDGKRDKFSIVSLSIPAQYGGYLKFFNFNPVSGCTISDDGQYCTLGYGSYVGLSCEGPNGFNKDIPENLLSEFSLQIVLVNDAYVRTGLNLELAPQYEFKVVYPLNNITKNPNSDKIGSYANPLYTGDGLEFTTKARLPIYRTGAVLNDYKMSVFNYPIQIQIPSIQNEDTVNSNNKDFELSLGVGTVTFGNSTTFSKSTELTTHNILPYLSDSDKYAKADEERIIMVNCEERLNCNDLANQNLATITEFNSAAGPIVKAAYYDLTLAEGLNSGLNSIKFNFKTINTNCNLKLLLFKSDEVFKELYCLKINDSDVVSINQNIIISDDDLETYGSKLVLRAPEYIDGSSKLILISINNIEIVSKNRDLVSGLPLNIPVVMTLPITIRRVNDRGELDVGNNPAVYYHKGGATHTLVFTLNLFNECDLSDRSQEYIRFLNREYTDGDVSEDLTIQRTIYDAQRISYMYGRFTEDPTIEFDADGNYIGDNFTTIDSNFVTYTDDTHTDYQGKPIVDSQAYLDSLLLGMNQLVSSIKIAASNSNQSNISQVKCFSGNLVNKLLEPRDHILSGYPVMWDDSTLFDLETGNPTAKYNQNLFENILGKTPDEVKSDLETGTASPIHELMMCIASFQDSKPLANIICVCDGSDESNGEPHEHIVAIQGTHESDKDYIFDLGIADF